MPDNTPPPPEEERLVLLRNLQQAFSTSYVTLISIIQGGALGYLVTVVDRVTDGGKDLTPLTDAKILLIFAALIQLVIVWNEYLMGVTVFNWIPTLVDALIPFGIGVTEVLVILAIENGTKWALVSLDIFYCIAFLGFLNMFYRSERAGVNRFTLSSVGNFKNIDLYSTLIGVVILTTVACFFQSSSPRSQAEILGAWFIVATMLFQVGRAWFYWKQIVRKAQTPTKESITPPA